jgi:hypothetical protein
MTAELSIGLRPTAELWDENVRGLETRGECVPGWEPETIAEFIYYGDPSAKPGDDRRQLLGLYV